MALIDCPECGKQVSDVAESCPRCGYPIAQAGQIRSGVGKTQLIEKTAKHYKRQQLYALLLMIISLILIFAGMPAAWYGYPAIVIVGGFGEAVGIIWFFNAYIGAWWHHG